jgi:transcription elongation factor Elf1
MDATTVRRKRITCPHCGKEQLVHLLAVPDKPALVIDKQIVRCVNMECEQDFDLLDENRIVDDPFAA